MNENNEQKSKPAVQCATLWGSVISVAGAAIPLVTVELAKMPPSSGIRVLTLMAALFGGFITVVDRLSDRKMIKGFLKTPCKPPSQQCERD